MDTNLSEAAAIHRAVCVEAVNQLKARNHSNYSTRCSVCQTSLEHSQRAWFICMNPLRALDQHLLLSEPGECAACDTALAERELPDMPWDADRFGELPVLSEDSMIG